MSVSSESVVGTFLLLVTVTAGTWGLFRHAAQRGPDDAPGLWRRLIGRFGWLPGPLRTARRQMRGELRAMTARAHGEADQARFLSVSRLLGDNLNLLGPGGLRVGQHLVRVRRYRRGHGELAAALHRGSELRLDRVVLRGRHLHLEFLGEPGRRHAVDCVMTGVEELR